MKIQSINNFNILYNSKFNTRPKNKTNVSICEGEGKKFIQSPETLKAYFLLNLYRQNNINFRNSNKFYSYSKDDFFKDFNPVEDYEYIEEFKDYAFESGKIKKEDFEKLSKEKQEDFILLSYEFLEKAKEELEIMDQETIINYSNILKNFFDKKYGKNKYRIIAPGTSASNIVQGMEYLGSEVIYLPFSNVRGLFNKRCCAIEDVDYSYKQFENAKIAMEYLSYKNVGKEKDKKTNIILDYSVRGCSIYCAAKFINEYLKEQNPKEKPKIKVYSLFDIIKEIETKDKKRSKKDEVKIQNNLTSFKHLCCKSCIENVSPVPHFNISNEYAEETGYIQPFNKTNEEIFKEFDNYSTPLSRLYSICLLDKARNLKK